MAVDEADHELKMTPLLTDRMIVVIPPGHPLERRKAIRLEDLTGVPLILTDPESSVRGLIDRAFAAIGHRAVAAYEVNYVATAVGLVKAGLGVAVLPLAPVLNSGWSNGVRVRDITHEGFVRTIGIIQKAGRSLSPAAEEFVRALEETCKKAPHVRSRGAS